MVSRELPLFTELSSVEYNTELNKDVYIDEKIRLQGIIDCFFEEEDGIVLLDYKTDYELRQILREKLRDKIVIVVAQRVATILNADKILVLEDGEVAGYGNHEILMKTNEIYREIAVSQGQEYEER